ncbi:hypothetical protein ACFY0B_25595 [Streptomyces sp. NPDC001797]|uniref:hypothetical protein n=1 Tax=Streptomyces sp. NPDC001797 TaxID=3364610 RepID=UPI0036960820
MTVSDAVRSLLEKGPLPSENEATDDDLEDFERLLEEIQQPVSPEEAQLLLNAFGTDNCYGLSWTLLHVIETSPVQPVISEDAATRNEWLKLLLERRKAS